MNSVVLLHFWELFDAKDCAKDQDIGNMQIKAPNDSMIVAVLQQQRQSVAGVQPGKFIRVHLLANIVTTW